MRQMPACSEAETQHRISGLDHRPVRRHICLSAGVGLYVRGFRTKQFLCARYGKRLDLVNIFTSAVVSASGVTLRVFIGQDAARSRKDRFRNDVLRCDQLNILSLSLQFPAQRPADFRVFSLYDPQAIIHKTHFASNLLKYFFTTETCFIPLFTAICRNSSIILSCLISYHVESFFGMSSGVFRLNRKGRYCRPQKRCVRIVQSNIPACSRAGRTALFRSVATTTAITPLTSEVTPFVKTVVITVSISYP